uniref:Uncharacterized protein n=1 Tax=Octactis speculum TaxID=3111310 RepID=A0A7S2D2A8_9STRA
MKCAYCGIEWCYICAKGLPELNMGPPSSEAASGSIYLHNTGWKYNPARCPMYIGELGNVDPDDWEYNGSLDASGCVDEDKIEEWCLDKLHTWRALQKLREVKTRLGNDIWSELHEIFASVRNSGYTDTQIDAAAQTPLFVRLDPPSLVDAESHTEYEHAFD